MLAETQRTLGKFLKNSHITERRNITTQIKLTPRAALLLAGGVACDVGCKSRLPLLAKSVYD